MKLKWYQYTLAWVQAICLIIKYRGFKEAIAQLEKRKVQRRKELIKALRQ